MQSHYRDRPDVSLTDRDLEFVVVEVAPEAKNPGYLKQLIMADDGFREGMIGDERLFQRIVDDDEILLIITPLGSVGNSGHETFMLPATRHRIFVNRQRVRGIPV